MIFLEGWRSSLGSWAIVPWVLCPLPLGRCRSILGYFLFAPCLPFASPLLAETQECVSTGWRLLSLSVCLLACRDAVRHVSTGRWLFRVSPLGRYIGWAAFLGRLVMVFFGGDGHSSSQGKSPGATHMSAPGCLVIVVQYVKPVGCLCLSGCRDAARHVSIDEIAFSLLCVETRFRVLTS